MCGIAGVMRVHATRHVPPAHDSIPDAWLDVLDQSIAFRGPDGSGRFRDRARREDGRVVDVALVHRRLTIIDPKDGAQPLLTGDGPDLLATVFNGCIYNHRELRRELQSLGRRFVTDHSDTEVIPHAHAAWGDTAPARLDGMFAYALWNRARANLLVARDYAGEKPLYEAWLRHSREGDVYIFASTVPALGRWLARFGSTFGWNGFRCEPSGLHAWLRYGGSLLPLLETIREVDVRVVSTPADRTPAENASGSPTRVGSTRHRYADLPARQAHATVITPHTVDELLARAVRSRLESDVPLGCFLSGGVDSSLVAWHARNALGSLRTFTVRMPDQRYDESSFAQQAAKIIGADHATLDCHARPAEDLQNLIAQLGLPFADSSLLPTYWVSGAARQHVKVALTGDGGDELFAGYERHSVAPLLARTHRLLRLVPDSLGSGSHPKSILAKLGRLGAAARGGYTELLSIFPKSLLALLVPGLVQQQPIAEFTNDAPRYDFEHYLPGDLLRKTDTAAMSVALETRAPFLSPEVIHSALTTPLSVLREGGRKGLLRAAARLHLPASLIDRSKMGFAIPIGDWLRSDYGSLGTLLRDQLATPEPFPSSLLGTEINRRVVNRLLSEHMQGTRHHSHRLHALLVLALWCREVGRWGR